MTLPDALRPEITAQLPTPPDREPTPSTVAVQNGHPTPPPTALPGRRALVARVRGRAKNEVRRAIRRVVGVGTTELTADVAGLQHRSDIAARDVERLRRDLDLRARDRFEAEAVSSQVHANRINLELLKGEVRALEAKLEELGMAFAPATGLAGAGARFAELREAVHAVERRVRTLDARFTESTRAPGAESDHESPIRSATSASADTPPSDGPTSALFDYVGFERRFRGDPVEILKTQADRYGDLLADAPGPIVDIGCGRGELLESLRDRGLDVVGVDTDPGMVTEARERGLEVHQTDAVSFLRSREPASLGAVFSAHLAEHLELDDLLQLIELSISRLAPGGLFVAETPNPASLIVLGNSYILDPTHVRPLHPSLFAFLCENAGFRDVRLHFYAPADGYHLSQVDDSAAPDWAKQINENFARLNEVLFGPQEYAVIARTAAA